MPNDFKDIWGLMNLLVPRALNDWPTFNVRGATSEQRRLRVLRL
jgi:hypothetical protein